MIVLDFKNVTKFYNKKKPGIINSTMIFNEGTIYGLVGPNGSGKSTLLKIINGLLTIDKGNINYLEKFSSIDSIRDYFGYVPDTESVWESLTAMEFIVYINQLFKQKINNHFFNNAEIFLNLFDLSDNKDDLLESFSFGMKKKIQIIATILHKPLLFSIDEPMFGLDPESIIILMELINTYVKKNVIDVQIKNDTYKVKPTVVLATHQLEYAEHYCTEFFLLSKNRLRMNGTKESIYTGLNVNNLNSAFIKSSGKEEIINKKLEMISSLY